MKNVILAASLFLSIAATAQPLTQTQTKTLKPVEEKKHSFGIVLEPHWLLIGGMGLKLETPVSDTVALELGGMYIPPRQNTLSDSDRNNNTWYYGETYKWSAYEVWVGARILMLGNYNTHALFVTPGIGYTGASISEYGSSNLSASLNTPEIRATVGYQWVLGSVRFAAGGGFRTMAQSDVVVSDSSGRETYRQKSSTLNGFVIDSNIAFLF